jgi:hypothetical protein
MPSVNTGAVSDFGNGTAGGGEIVFNIDNPDVREVFDKDRAALKVPRRTTAVLLAHRRLSGASASPLCYVCRPFSSITFKTDRCPSRTETLDRPTSGRFEISHGTTVRSPAGNFVLRGLFPSPHHCAWVSHRFAHDFRVAPGVAQMPLLLQLFQMVGLRYLFLHFSAFGSSDQLACFRGGFNS